MTLSGRGRLLLDLLSLVATGVAVVYGAYSSAAGSALGFVVAALGAWFFLLTAEGMLARAYSRPAETQGDL